MTRPPVTKLDPSGTMRDGVMGNRNARVSLIDQALQNDATRCTTQLYRALTRAEVADQGDVFTVDAYTMLTESLDVALGHLRATGTDTVLMCSNLVGLNYLDFLKHNKKALVDSGMDEQRVDARIARADAEKEWVIGPGFKFNITIRREGSGRLAGKSVLVCEPAFEGHTIEEVMRSVKQQERASIHTRGRRMSRTKEVALITRSLPDNAETDNLLLMGGSDPVARYDNMVMRRKTAALCSQPRVVQELDRKINLLRAALGMTPERPTPVRNSGRAFDQNVDVFDAPDPFDRDWLRERTTACVATWCNTMRDRGFAIDRVRGDGLTRWRAVGAERGHGAATYEVHVVGGAWCTAATRNGVDLGLFDTCTPAADGPLASMASDDWDGKISGPDAQHYLRSWSTLISGQFTR